MKNKYPEVWVYSNYREVDYGAHFYYKKYKKDNIKFSYSRNYSGIHEFITDKEWFIIMPSATFDSWCKGRTYYLDSSLCHSGLKIKEEDL